MGKMQDMRDFQKRAARGDPRAMRDFATGKVPLPVRYRPAEKATPVKKPPVKAGSKAFRDKMNKQQIKHPPSESPAKAKAQTRNASAVDKYFGGSKRVPKNKQYEFDFKKGGKIRLEKAFRKPSGGTRGISGKGGGGGIGNIFDSGTGTRVGKRRPGQ